MKFPCVKDVPECIVLGHGPSLESYVHKKGDFIIGCNSWYDFYDFFPDVWVLANTKDRITTTYLEYMKIFSGIVFYADSVDLTPRCYIENIAVAHGTVFEPFDERHHDSKTCAEQGRTGHTINGISCCDHIINGRLTIQERLQKVSGHKEHFDKAVTVAAYMVTYALLTGFKKIFCYGLDFDYKKGYASNTGGFVHGLPDEFDKPEHKKSWQIITESADLLGAEIIRSK
uniref:DUF115 domain-containing protein n=1 Tax=viral metagenome TaxID=1070528 RepID=A0A6M3LZL3_9ZZZZ